MVERQDDGGRELRLEGVGLVLGGGVLLAMLVGAFFLGRWVERQSPPAEQLALTTTGPLSQIAERKERIDASQGLDHFDGGEGQAQPEEPERELKRRAATPEPKLPTVESDGDFFVQVGAMRDRSSATAFIGDLKLKGYPARLFSEGEGQGRLYKVRVGGFPSRQAAGAARDRLRTDGHPGAFLWPSS